MSARTDPYSSFRFTVNLQFDSVIVAGFSEVSGLEVTMEPETVEEGGLNTRTRKLPKRYDHPNLVLKRGLTDDQHLFQWLNNARHGQIERKSGEVVLLDACGRQSMGWAFKEAYPVKWSGPSLRADQGSVAIESLELAHRGLSKMEGLPSENQPSR